MLFIIGCMVVVAIIIYQRATGIIRVNPLSHQAQSLIPTATPDYQNDDDNEDSADEAPSAISEQARAAIRRLVENNQAMEAIQLYRRLYKVDLATAKKAIAQLR